MNVPTTYESAQALYRSARHRWNGKPVGRNTRVYGTEFAGEQVYTLRFHGTDIVTYHADRALTLRCGGWHTVTTRQRLNLALRRRGWRVASTQGIQYIYRSSRELYVWMDGMRVLADDSIAPPPGLELEPLECRLYQRRREAAAARQIDNLFRALFRT